MSSVVGIDFSSFAIDLVKLDETEDAASWTHVKLDGGGAWDRTRHLPLFMPKASWWDDVYLCAIEAPMGFKSQVLYRVQGALLSTIPQAVWTWEVRLHEWKGALGLKPAAKPAWSHFPGMQLDANGNEWAQDVLDALGVAKYARDTNQKALDAA